MTLEARPFEDRDYAAFVGVVNAAYPEYPEPEEEWRRSDATRDPKCRWGRWLAECGGEVAGAAEYDQNAGRYHPRKFSISVWVRPEYRRRGVGARLYGQLTEALEPLDPLQLRANTREDQQDALAFLGARGFEECMRSWESRLSVPDFDLSPYAGCEERPRSHGVEVRTYAELAGDPERDRKLFALFDELRADVPSLDPPTPVEFERWLERNLKSPNLLPDGWIIAVHDGQYVGSSQLWSGTPLPVLYTGLTGVKREYRRMGIALTLKIRGIAYAQAQGAPEIRTWNESNNRPMLSINERLGFLKQPAWIDFVKVLRQE